MRIEDFKDKHKGERCYILGNGPGLADIDLGKLDFPTFGTNRIYLADYTPDYYCAVNPLVLEQFRDEIGKVDAPRFIAEPYAMEGEIALDTTNTTPSFDTPEGAIYEGYTVTYVCLQLAYYMGFTDVILLGVDHSFSQPSEALKGTLEITNKSDDVNHFHKDYFGKGVKWHSADLRKSGLAYGLAKKAFEADGRTITNCSTRTKLDIFPVLPLNHYLADDPPRVSALVSAYKSEEFFVDCIKDLEQQTLWERGELEIVVICQRGSWEHNKASSMAFDDKPAGNKFTVVITDDIPSVFVAWNIGARKAVGEYLTYANTDDRHDVRAFEIAADIMDTQPGIDLTYHDSFITWERNQSYDDFIATNKDTELVHGRKEGKPGIFQWPEYSLPDLRRGCYIGPQPMWRANLHQRVGYFHKDYPTAGDYEFWLRFAKEANMLHIPYTLGLYLARHDGIEMGNKEKSQEETREALKLHYGANPDMSVLKQLPVRAWPWPRILVHIPMTPALNHADSVFYDFMAIATNGPAFVDAGYNKIELAREKGCQKLMETDFTHILMLDSDHKHPKDIIQRLARWVIEDPERLMVGGLNFRRGAPYDPCAFVDDGEGGYGTLYSWGEGLVPVDYIGMGSILIAREALERIEQPWFYYQYEPGKVDNGWYAEDIHFCRKAKEAGIQIYCDTSTTSPHMISMFVDENSFRQYVEDHADEAEIIPNPKKGVKGVKDHGRS